MLAFIDIHKHVFQAALLEPGSGQVTDTRFAARPEALEEWLDAQPGLSVVAVEATTGWRWVARLLEQRGIELRLVDPGQARALQGKKHRPKTDRLDCRWGVVLLAKELLPQAWLAPEEIQQLRDKTRLRRRLSADRTRWAQRVHALLQHEGWPCSRKRLLTREGRAWLSRLRLSPHARAQVDLMCQIMGVLDASLDQLDRELSRFARHDPRTRALLALRGVGPIIACVLVAEIGDATRFQRARQVVRAAGLDPIVAESADTRRRGRLAKAGSPQLRHALIQAAIHANHPSHPDHQLQQQVRRRSGTANARLTIARKLARRAYHILNDLELEQAA